MKRNFPILITLIAFAAFAVSAQSNSREERELKALVEKLTTAQAEYDAVTLDRLFTADYIEISPAGEFDPRVKVLTFYTPEEKSKAAGMSVSVDENFRSVRIYRDTAVLITELAFTMTRDGNNRSGPKMMATIVARKEKGIWKVASAQYTGIRPPTPPKPSGE